MKILILIMLTKQRNLVLSIFILGILFIVILLQYVPKYKIQALLVAKSPQLKTSNVKMQIQRIKWTKPSQRKHQTNKSAVKNVQIRKGSHHVHVIDTSLQTLPNVKRLGPKTFSLTSKVRVYASTPHLRSSDVRLRQIATHLRANIQQIRASSTQLRVNTEVRASKTKDRARNTQTRAGMVRFPTAVNISNYSIPSVRGVSSLKANAKSSPAGAASHNHSELKTYQTTSRSIGLTLVQARKTIQSDEQRTRVVILAHGRSGSSFLGGIFNAHPDVFFIYEPLLTLLNYVNISSDGYLDNVEEVLHSILNCNFTDNSYLKYLSKFDRHRAMSNPLVSPPLCNVNQYEAINFQEHRKWRRCVKNIPARALNDVCRKKRHVVIKVLAARLISADFSWLLRVCGARSSPVRMLYLVRDPRAMHFSRYKLGWIAPQARRRKTLENGLVDSKVKRTCEIIEQHLRMITQHADHIQVIRYEDLATNPETFIRRLFTSLRLRPSENVTRWLEEKNHAQVGRGNYFSLSRESKTIVTAWQKSIPAKLVTIVEKRCRRIMKYLGYVPTNGSNTLLRNLQKPLYSDEWGIEQL